VFFILHYLSVKSDTGRRAVPLQSAVVTGVCIGPAASSAAGRAGHRVLVWRSAGGGGDGQPQCHEQALQPAVGAHLQLRARPTDLSHHDLAGQARERPGRPAGDAQDRQG